MCNTPCYTGFFFQFYFSPVTWKALSSWPIAWHFCQIWTLLQPSWMSCSISISSLICYSLSIIEVYFFSWAFARHYALNNSNKDINLWFLHFSFFFLLVLWNDPIPSRNVVSPIGQVAIPYGGNGIFLGLFQGVTSFWPPIHISRAFISRHFALEMTLPTRKGVEPIYRVFPA
jgi:hypothetical protein